MTACREFARWAIDTSFVKGVLLDDDIQEQAHRLGLILETNEPIDRWFDFAGELADNAIEPRMHIWPAEWEISMTARDEARAMCIKASALAIARNMLPEHNLQSLDDLDDYLRGHYLSAGKDAFDSLNGIVTVNPPEATEEIVKAGKSAYPMIAFDARLVWRAMVLAGDLTNPPEKKP